jgi:hypothetical protein
VFLFVPNELAAKTTLCGGQYFARELPVETACSKLFVALLNIQ